MQIKGIFHVVSLNMQNNKSELDFFYMRATAEFLFNVL